MKLARKLNYQLVGKRGRNLPNLKEHDWILERGDRHAVLTLRAELRQEAWQGTAELWFSEPGMGFKDLELSKLLVDQLEKMTDGTQCWAETKKRYVHWATHI